MSKRRSPKNPERALLIAGVLDDPRWEKLASNEANDEEVTDLRAWAKQSKVAEAVWEVFRPATALELADLTVSVLQKLNPRKRQRAGDLVSFSKRRTSGDCRMMARHSPLQRENRRSSVMRLTPVSRFVEKSTAKATGKDKLRLLPPALPAMPRPTMGPARGHAPIKTHKPRVQMNIPEPIRSDASGTTTSRMALSRDAAETSSLIASSITNQQLHHPPSRRKGRKSGAFMMFVATLALLVSFVSMLAAIAWNNNGAMRAASPVPPNPLAATSIELALPVMVAPLPSSLSAASSETVVHTMQPTSIPSASTAPVQSAANSAVRVAPPNKSREKTIDVCTGVGLFKRCKKAPLPSKAMWERF